MRFRAPNPPTLGYTGSRPFEPLNLGVPRFVSVPATVSGLNHARPTDIERGALDIRFRAPNPPTLVFTGPRPLQPLVLGLPRFASVPATVSGWNPARPTDIERSALDIRFCAPNPPTLVFTGPRPLQLLIFGLPRFASVPTAFSRSNSPCPTDIECVALNFWLRRQTPFFVLPRLQAPQAPQTSCICSPPNPTIYVVSIAVEFVLLNFLLPTHFAHMLATYIIYMFYYYQ
jgi:hypothetical protein